MPQPSLDPRPHMVIAGASGLIGRRLVAACKERWRVTVLTRSVSGNEPEGATPLAWTPTAAKDGDVAHLEGLGRVLSGADVLVNLAGASVADGRFDEAHRTAIVDSRLDATTTLVQAAARAEHAPRSWLQASATGLYGDRGEEELDENSEPDTSFFMGQVGVAWEQAAAPAAAFSRLIIGRIGVVFAPEAEAWRRLVLPVRLGVGGPLGPGTQWWPWIHAEDLIDAMLFLIDDEEASGTYALSAPEPARQVQITRTAARALRRPAIVPVPAFALRLLLGGMPDMVLFPSTKVRPVRLLEHGFEFRYPTIDAAVEGLLKA